MEGLSGTTGRAFPVHSTLNSGLGTRKELMTELEAAHPALISIMCVGTSVQPVVRVKYSENNLNNTIIITRQH